MGTITTTQPGGTGTFTGSGQVFPGMRAYFSYAGSTTSWTWTLQSKPSGSVSAVTQTGSTCNIPFDVIGSYTVRFTDSGSVNTDVTITAAVTTPTVIIDIDEGNNDVVLRVPGPTSGRTGRAFTLKAQDTDVGNIGGSMSYQSGRGFDSNGHQWFEGEGNSAFLQAFSEGGANPIFTIIGNGSGTPQFKFQQGDGELIGTGGMYLTATADYIFARVSSTHYCFRLGSIGSNGAMRVGDSTAPSLECLEVARNAYINGALRYGSLPITDKSGGGAIGTAAATVDVATSFDVSQTTAAQTLTLPSPTTATSGRLVLVSNTGSVSFTMLGATVASGGSLLAKWTGAAWSKVS